MPNDFTVNLGELVKLADELEGAGDRLVAAVTPVVKRGAQNIKTEARRTATTLFAGGYARRYPSTISYDLFEDDGQVIAEIGPDKDLPQGALGNLLEYGSSNNAPMPHLNPAAEAEYPKTQVQLVKAAARAMLQ